MIMPFIMQSSKFQMRMLDELSVGAYKIMNSIAQFNSG